eukprot:scaffold65305_cov66-Phaeocystis_antarctica.AAC.1
MHARAHSAGHLRHWYGVGRCGCSQDLGPPHAPHSSYLHRGTTCGFVPYPQRPAAQLFWAKAGRLVTSAASPVALIPSGLSPVILAHSYTARSLRLAPGAYALGAGLC